MRKFWLIAALCALAAAAQAQGPSPATEWYRAGHVSLRLTDAAHDVNAAWQFDRADNGDNRVLREERRGGVKFDGAVMSICDDQALVIKGIPLERGREMRALDDPVLYLQMLLRLLARAVPEGPAAFGGDKLVEISEPKAALRVRKGLEARRDFNAPWQARGRIMRDAAGDISYDIVLNHAGDGAEQARTELKAAGVWRPESLVHSFADSMDIADWQVYRVNAVPVTVGGNTQMESMANIKPLRYADLGHLRRHIERAWSPNPKVAPALACKP